MARPERLSPPGDGGSPPAIVVALSGCADGPGRALALRLAARPEVTVRPVDVEDPALADRLDGVDSVVLLDLGPAVAADLDDASGRAAAAERLVSGADVVLQSFRPGALAGLGYGDAQLAGLRPGLVVAQVSAYGPDGPWRNRRGFDSLVQMATGIAAEGMRRAGVDQPVPLPVQALDHGAGWLTALGVVQALRREEAKAGWLVETSLARTASWLDALGRDDHPEPVGLPAVPLATVGTAFGVLSHVPMPGRIGRLRPTWSRPPAPPTSAAWLA